MKRIWQKWTTITKKVAKSIASIVLILVFIFIFLPVSLVLKTFFKETLLGHGGSLQKNTYWRKRQKIKQDLHFAKEQ